MEISLEDIPPRATLWEVKEVLGAILHGPNFFDPAAEKARRL